MVSIALLAWSCEEDPVAPPEDDGDIPVVTDRTPPHAVSDLGLSYDPSTHDVRLTWTAPRDDADHDRVAQYQIRHAYAFPLDWSTALPIADPPAPLSVGAAQEYLLAGLDRGRDLYAAIRSVDVAGNVSAVSSVAYVRVPGFSFEAVCEDAMTGLPVEGLDVRMVGSYSYNFVTDAGGRISLSDVSEGSLDVRIETGAAAAAYHGLDHAFVLDHDYAASYPMIEFMPVTNVFYENVFDMLREAVIGGPVLKKWANLPVPWYAPAFVNANGLDYYDSAARAAARWNDATGLSLFVAVDARPTVGVYMEFLPPALMGGLSGVTSYGSDAQGYPILDRIRILDAFVDGTRLDSIMMHELGHTIRLGHLAGSMSIMFASQPLPLDISADEVRVVQLLTALPNGTDLSIYDLSPTP